MKKKLVNGVCLTSAIILGQGALMSAHASPISLKKIQRVFTSCVGRPSVSTESLNGVKRANSTVFYINVDETKPYYKNVTTSSGLTHKVKVTTSGVLTETYNSEGDLVITSNKSGGSLVTSWLKNGQVYKTEVRDSNGVNVTRYDSDGNITLTTMR